MRKLILALFVIFSALSLASEGPRLEIIGGNTYNWMDVYPSANPLLAKIILKNTGGQTLYIKRVKPGCSCTSAPPEKSLLKPGEEVYMDVSLEITQNDSKMDKTIEIVTNEIENPVTIIHLKANVIKPLEISSRGIFAFKKMEVGKKNQAVIKAKNISEDEIKLYGIKIKPEGASLNINEGVTIAPGEEIDFVLTATPENTGPFNCTVEMKTNHPEMPEVKLFGGGRAVKAEKGD